MKILFIVYHGLSSYSGISKKIMYQVKGLKELGHEVYLYTYGYDEKGNKVRKINNTIIENLGKGLLAPIKNRINYSILLDFTIQNKIEFIYARSFHNADPFLINLFRNFKKNKIKSVIEIPTFPYDLEYKSAPFHIKFKQFINHIYRKKLVHETDAIVTFSSESYIWGQRTIRISNGIDFNSIKLKTNTTYKTNEIHLIGVAEVHYWHGYDRIIAGIGEYYKNSKKPVNIYFHIVGGIAKEEMKGSPICQGFLPLINKYHIEKSIIFHGQKFGKDLDNLFEISIFAIGSLARHRCGITQIKTLKNREYAARGIPFIYSEIDEDFTNMPYTIKAPANESPIDIQNILNFINRINFTPTQIRNSIKYLSWKNQLKRMIDEFNQFCQ